MRKRAAGQIVIDERSTGAELSFERPNTKKMNAADTLSPAARPALTCVADTPVGHAVRILVELLERPALSLKHKRLVIWTAPDAGLHSQSAVVKPSRWSDLPSAQRERERDVVCVVQLPNLKFPTETTYMLLHICM